MWKLSDILIYSAPITYFGVWIIVLLILMIYEVDYKIKTAMIAYAAAPIGAITEGFSGYCLSLIGL